MTAYPNSVALPEWDLTDLYAAPDASEFKNDLSKAQEESRVFSEFYCGKLAQLDGGALAVAIESYEKLLDILGRLGSYAFLYYAGDITAPMRVKFYGDINAKLTEISKLLLFFPLELNRIDDPLMEKALATPALKHYEPWLIVLRQERPYQLDNRLEELFLEKSQTSFEAFNRLFDETMASLRFAVQGQSLELEPTLNLLLKPDENQRRAAAEALAQTFKKNIRLFTLITNVLAKDKEISDRWRGFKDVADQRHLANQLEGEVVAALSKAVSAAYPKLSHRYYAMKAKWLGKDQLMHWDRNAPLPQQEEKELSWEQAKKLVLDAYAEFSPEMAGIAASFFAKKWIDAPLRPGKMSGAFSHPTVPSAHPFILLNYQGKRRDVMTLAHELGHGVHQVLAAPQGALMANTPLTLAETASVFGEMLTFQAMLKATKDQEQRKVLLASKVEDMLNTAVRQIAFYQFEYRLHWARRDGELTSDQINDIWMSIQHESLGPAVKLGPGYETFWCYVPHFIHTPFYVYSYAFGECLVNSLYACYQKNMVGFKEKYFAMLRAGGSKSHREILKPFGLDAADPHFWQAGLSVISGFIDELEQMENSSS